MELSNSNIKKLLIFQEVTFRAQKMKKKPSQNVSGRNLHGLKIKNFL